MTRRFWVAVVFWRIPVLLLAMLPMIGVPDRSVAGGGGWRVAANAAEHAGRDVGGLAIFSSAAGDRVVTWNLNMFTLIAIGTGAAYVYSLFAVLFPACFPSDFSITAAEWNSISKRRR